MRRHALPTWAAAVLAATPLAAAEGSAGGPFAGDVGNALWTLLIFSLVVLVLGRYAWGPLLRGLQAREEFIRTALESARADREQAATRLAEYEAKLIAARNDATAIVDEARRDAEALRRRIQEEGQAEARQTIERARREVAQATEAAKRELHAYAGDLAVQIAGKVLAREVRAADHERLIAESIARIEQGGN